MITIEPMTRRRLAGGPPHLRRGDRDRRRHARARGARLEPLRSLATRPSAGSSPGDGTSRLVVGWTALGHYSARQVYSGVAWESVYVADGCPRVAGSVGRSWTAPHRGVPRRRASGPSSPASSSTTPRASPSIGRSASAASASSERWAEDASGRWRDVVLLERRSPSSVADQADRSEDDDVDGRLPPAILKGSVFGAGFEPARRFGRVHADQQFAGRRRGRQAGRRVDRVADAP